MSAAAVQCDPSAQFGVTLKSVIFFLTKFCKDAAIIQDQFLLRHAT